MVEAQRPNGFPQPNGYGGRPMAQNGMTGMNGMTARIGTPPAASGMHHGKLPRQQGQSAPGMLSAQMQMQMHVAQQRGNMAAPPQAPQQQQQQPQQQQQVHQQHQQPHHQQQQHHQQHQQQMQLAHGGGGRMAAHYGPNGAALQLAAHQAVYLTPQTQYGGMCFLQPHPQQQQQQQQQPPPQQQQQHRPQHQQQHRPQQQQHHHQQPQPQYQRPQQQMLPQQQSMQRQAPPRSAPAAQTQRGAGSAPAARHSATAQPAWPHAESTISPGSQPASPADAEQGAAQDGPRDDGLMSRPCVHNEWDDVRTRRHHKILQCRVCHCKWKLRMPVARCSSFLHGKCPRMDDCDMLHVYKKKGEQNGPQQQGDGGAPPPSAPTPPDSPPEVPAPQPPAPPQPTQPHQHFPMLPPSTLPPPGQAGPKGQAHGGGGAGRGAPPATVTRRNSGTRGIDHSPGIRVMPSPAPSTVGPPPLMSPTPLTPQTPLPDAPALPSPMLIHTGAPLSPRRRSSAAGRQPAHGGCVAAFCTAPQGQPRSAQNSPGLACSPSAPVPNASPSLYSALQPQQPMQQLHQLQQLPPQMPLHEQHPAHPPHDCPDGDRAPRMRGDILKMIEADSSRRKVPGGQPAPFSYSTPLSAEELPFGSPTLPTPALPPPGTGAPPADGAAEHHGENDGVHAMTEAELDELMVSRFGPAQPAAGSDAGASGAPPPPGAP